MRLFKMLNNRKRKFKTFLPMNDSPRGEYFYGEYTISVFDTVSEYIMWHVLDMDYFWSYESSMKFYKVYTLESLLGDPTNEQE